jgi:hypothetical protein
VNTTHRNDVSSQHSVQHVACKGNAPQRLIPQVRSLLNAQRLPVLSLIVIAGVLWAAFLYWVPAGLHMPLARDQGIFAWVGTVVLRGGLPYADAWEVKGPAAHFLYAAALLVFGKGESAIRILDLCMWGVSAGAFTLLSRGLTGKYLPGLLGTPLLLYFSHADYWNTAQPDLWAGIFLLSSLACAIGLPGHRWNYAGAGLFIGVAALVKPFYAAFLLVLLLQAWFEGAGALKKAALQLFASSSVPVIAVLVLYAWHRQLPELIDVMLRFNVRVHVTAQHPISLRQGVGNFLVQTSLSPSGAYVFLWMFAIYGWLRLSKRSRKLAALLGCVALASTLFVLVRSYGSVYMPYWVSNARVLLEALALIGWFHLYKRSRQLAAVTACAALAGVVFIFVQNKFYVYHYATLWVFVAALAATGIASMVGAVGMDANFSWTRWRLGSICVGWVVWITIPGIVAHAAPYWHLRNRTLTDEQYQAAYCSGDFCHGALKEAARFVRAHTRPDEKIYLWGFDALVYFLADRQAPTRFGFSYPLVVDATEPRRQKRDELMRDLCKEPPAMFLVQTHDGNNLTTRSSGELLAEFPALQQFLDDHYRLQMRNNHISVYQLDRSIQPTAFCAAGSSAAQ